MITSFFGMTMDQVHEEIVWQNLSRGFQGGFYTAQEITVFELGAEKCTIEFAVKEFSCATRDCDSFFVFLCVVKETRFGECHAESNWCLGEDFYQARHAMDFADYVLSSFKKHQDFSRLPVKELDHWAFKYL
jgi:hypothetical protein